MNAEIKSWLIMASAVAAGFVIGGMIDRQIHKATIALPASAPAATPPAPAAAQ